MNIRNGKKERLYRKDLNESIIAKMHTSRIINITQSKIISIEEYTSEKYMHEMSYYHLRALLNDKCLPLLKKYNYELNYK